MNRSFALLVIIAVSVATLGCSGLLPPPRPSGTPDTLTPAPTQAPDAPSAETGVESLPIDPELSEVSLSSPSPAAKLALDRCGLFNYPEYVGGIAEIPHAREATKWVRLYGTEPDLRSESPAVLITVKGEINLRGTVFIEPICFVVDGQANWISSGAKRSADGAIVQSKLVPRDPPTMRLPPLVP